MDFPAIRCRQAIRCEGLHLRKAPCSYIECENTFRACRSPKAILRLSCRQFVTMNGRNLLNDFSCRMCHLMSIRATQLSVRSPRASRSRGGGPMTWRPQGCLVNWIPRRTGLPPCTTVGPKPDGISYLGHIYGYPPPPHT